MLRSGHLSQGEEGKAFEEECAAFVGRRYAVAVNSGTSALHLALGALGVAPNEPVAVPSYGCAALITAVRLQHARPILGDIDDSFNLDPEQVSASCRIAILAHLFGARGHAPKGRFIEDIAQSLGGPTGRHGIVAIASFYATKLMTTGEGGMVLTDDAEIAAYVRDRRDYDNRDDFEVRFNYKLTDLQAAVGRAQLAKLPSFIARRQAIAARYCEAFKDLPVRLPKPKDHVFFRYAIATADRDRLEAYLQDCGVEAKRPVYRPAHHYLGGEFPNPNARTASVYRCRSIPR